MDVETGCPAAPGRILGVRRWGSRFTRSHQTPETRPPEHEGNRRRPALVHRRQDRVGGGAGGRAVTVSAFVKLQGFTSRGSRVIRSRVQGHSVFRALPQITPTLEALGRGMGV
ncbi:hypothetical protein AAFF_G00085710 [Aldrovandia affinis]|uniref:Uncharacterized protein n=1 Tax=Aldrovandia affinis TaxID=143900 RepID=A0AAD7WDC6_9TELE|nr:hypothetical protein AAFF_G00085710 [Aldrovandia affinis]